MTCQVNPQYTMPSSNSMYQSNVPHNAGNIFRKRVERIDWKKLAGADVDYISRNMDYFTLQDNIQNVAFCNIEAELDLQNIDSNFVKLFKLAQLTIEYLLFSQEYLNSRGKEMEALLKKEKENSELSLKKLEKCEAEMNEMRKESHRRKKMILAQQQMLQSGNNAYNKCAFCSKAFVNPSFLQSHLMRRHMDQVGSQSTVTSHTQATPPQPQSILVQSTPVAQLPSNNNSAPTPTVSAPTDKISEQLSAQLEEIRERLRLTESQLVDERNVMNSAMKKEKMEQDLREHEMQQEMKRWKEEQEAAHKVDMDRTRDMFMQELKEMNEKYANAEKNVAKLQHNLAQHKSHLGDLQDDIDKEMLVKQREEVAVLKEELSQQVEKVESEMAKKMEKKEEEWKAKMKQLSREHKQTIHQMHSALESSMSELERERGNKLEAQTTYQQHVEELQNLIQQSKESETRLKEQEVRTEERVTKTSKQVTSASRPVSAPVSAPLPAPSQPRPNPNQNMQLEDDDDDDDDDDDLETTEASESLATRTIPTMGTLSLSEARNQRLADLLKKNPQVVKDLREQLRGILEQELEKRGIDSGKGLSINAMTTKLALLKQERQQTAKKHKNLFEIRQHCINQVDLLAKEQMKKMKPPAQQPAPAPARPTSAPTHSSSQQKQRLGSSAPLPEVPAPKKSAGPPRPAPRSLSPQNTKNATSVSFSTTAQSVTASSTNWDSDLDEETTDGITTETPGPSTVVRGNTGVTPHKIPSFDDKDDDEDESGLEEISDLEELSEVNRQKTSAPVTVAKPKGAMVEKLSRSIEQQLMGRSGKKPVGGVNTMTDKTTPPNNGLDDDDSFTIDSSDEDQSTKPKPSARSSALRGSSAVDTSYSTNTYGTSMWAGPNSAAQQAGPATQGSIGKTSVNISEWGSDDDFDLDDVTPA